jgi:hypothetical protein
VLFAEDSSLLVRILFAAVLFAGCAAPVIQPSLSHPPDCESGHRAEVEATRTLPPGRRELRSNLPVSRTPNHMDGVRIPRDSTWTDLLPSGDKSACLVILVVTVIVAIATVTLWR